MKFMSLDSKFFQGLNKAVDILYLNFLWVIFSIPIVTIGASTTAAYYVGMKMVNDEEGYIGRAFVKAFKENFKKSTIVWVVMLVLAEALYINYQLLGSLEDPSILLYIATIVGTFLYIVVFLAIFPLMARYENTISQTIRNSYMITIRHFAHTLGMLLILAIFVFFFFLSSTTMYFGILFGPGLLIYIASSCYLKLFEKIITGQEALEKARKELNEERKVES